MTRWWQTRSAAIVVLLLSIVPLLWPAVPPLTDLPGHIGTYRVLTEPGSSPLAQHYSVHWAIIGNLGVDALVLALHPLLDVEAAAKLVVTAVPPLTVAAALWLAREVHGRIPATALFALPLVYAFPFQLGFVNFCLASALVLAAMAGWIRLARTRPTWVRIVVFAMVAAPIWLCHSFGWAMLGLFVFAIEWRLRSAAGQPWWRAAFLAGLCCTPMAIPAFLLIRSGDALVGGTGDWLDFQVKAEWAISILRERWRLWDVLSACVLYGLVAMAWRSRRLRLDPILAAPALLGGFAFVLLPRFYQGGSYIDMRILPLSMMLAILAIRPESGDDRLERRLAIGGAVFAGLRLAVTIITFAQLSTAQAAQLQALAMLPVGGATLVLVDQPGPVLWDGEPRLAHLAGLAIARRRVFVNEQWSLAGQQLIAPRHPGAAPFDRDPSQLIYPADGEFSTTDFDAAIAGFDRCTFDRVWTIGFPGNRAHAADLAAIWAQAGSAVYRVAPHRCLSDPLRQS